MNGDNKLKQSIEKIDEKYIEEAYLYKGTRKIKTLFEKVTFAVAAAAVILLIVVCVVGNNDDTVKHEVISAKEVYYESLEELEEHSVLVVRGVRQNGEKPVVNMVNGTPTTVYSLSEFEITEIYEDKTGIYKVGDVITIYENAAYVESLNIIEHVAGYDMMVSGCEYLLFLNVAIEGSKPIYIAGNYGTVSLEEDGRYSMIAELGGDVKEYKKIWDEAKEKYIKDAKVNRQQN